MPDNQCLCIFIKSPVTGPVKSRLAAEVGTKKALSLYSAMVKDLVRNLHSSSFSIRYYVTSSGRLPLQLGNMDKPDIVLQHGRTLGSRMINAFRNEFEKGMKRIILIGSDIPAIDHVLISDFFDHLDTADAVIGPAEDGGYYLIGMKKEVFTADLFAGIPWSSPTVCQETLHRFQKNGISWHKGLKLQDIDDVHDLFRVINNRELHGKIPHLLAESSDLINHA